MYTNAAAGFASLAPRSGDWRGGLLRGMHRCCRVTNDLRVWDFDVSNPEEFLVP
jgi:hypothetical protein